MSSIERMNKEYFLMLGRGSSKTLMLKRYLKEMMIMSNFEVGDKVKLVRLDIHDRLYVPMMNRFLGETMTITQFYKHCDFLDVSFEETTLWFNTDWLELVKKHKPEYWNGKFIVVGECSTKSWLHPRMQPVTIGKVYELKDGKVTLDDGRVIQNYNYKTFDAFASRLREFGVRIIEFKGFCRNEGNGKNE